MRNLERVILKLKDLPQEISQARRSQTVSQPESQNYVDEIVKEQTDRPDYEERVQKLRQRLAEEPVIDTEQFILHYPKPSE